MTEGIGGRRGAGRRLRATVALTAAVALLLAACTVTPTATQDTGGPTSTETSTTATGSAPATPTVAPALPVRPASAPAPAPLTPARLKGTPAQQAAAAATAFASPDAAVRLPALVAALGASGVPVIGPDGAPLPGTAGSSVAPLGLPWVHVAGVAITNPEFSITFADAVRILDAAQDPVREADPAATAALLAAVRAGLRSRNVQTAFFSALLAASNARLGGAPLAAAATKPEQVRLDMATLEVFVGRALRMEFVAAVLMKANRALGGRGSAAVVPASALPAGPVAGRLAPGTQMAPAAGGLPAGAPPPNCADDGTNGWAVWIVSKALGGVDVSGIGGEGASWGGVADWFSKNLVRSGNVAPQTAARVAHAAEFLGKFANHMNAALSILNYLFELAMLTATATMEGGEPLVRHKRKSEGDGEAKKILVRVEMKMPDSARGGSDAETDATATSALNCLLALGVAVGNNAFMPTEGPQQGLRVDIEGGEGFTSGLAAGNSIVLFGPDRFEPYQDTDANGELRIPVQGRQQKRDYPDDATPVKRTFGIALTSTLEPTDGTSIGKTFADSLLCAAAPGLGCADAATDILKTFHYSLGEKKFPLRDWAAGWAIDETIKVGGGTMTVKGVSCQSEKGPWRLTFTVQGSGITGRGVETFTFPGDQAGPATQPLTTSASYTWHFEGAGGFGDGTGTDKATLVPDGDAYRLRMEADAHSTTGHAAGLSATGSGSGGGGGEFQVRQATEAECGTK